MNGRGCVSVAMKLFVFVRVSEGVDKFVKGRLSVWYLGSVKEVIKKTVR